MADNASDDGQFTGGGGAPVAPGITVNPADLAAFAEDIEIDLRDNISPVVDLFERGYSGGGRGADSGAAFITDERYSFASRVNDDHYTYAAEMIKRLHSVMRGLSVIASAARLMAEDFRTVDEQNTIDIVDANGYLGRAQRGVDADGEPAG